MSRLVILLLSLIAAGVAYGQSVVTLKPVARLDVDAPIRLADIATLTGESKALAELIVNYDPASHSGPDRRLTVELKDIRELIASSRSLSTGQISIRGDTCRVILRAKHSEMPTESAGNPALKPDVQVGYTVRDHVKAKLVQTLNVDADHLQFSFDDADASLLSTATRGWTVDVQPTGSSAKVPMRITMYDKHGGIRDESIRVGVRILREIVRTKRAVRRGSSLTLDDYEIDEAWLAPDVQFIEPISASGIRLKRSIGAGEMLTSGHAELAEVVKKGDIVAIHLVSGTIVIRTPARALESGRVGDQIEFASLQTEGSFVAEVKAPGRAVVMTSTTPIEEFVR
jgi:flagella basal body P-ring formation protein FlgA